MLLLAGLEVTSYESLREGDGEIPLFLLLATKVGDDAVPVGTGWPTIISVVNHDRECSLDAAQKESRLRYAGGYHHLGSSVVNGALHFRVPVQMAASSV